MSNFLSCSSCGNPMLGGVTDGRLACPACGSLITPPEGAATHHRVSFGDTRATRWLSLLLQRGWLTSGVLLVLLALFLVHHFGQIPAPMKKTRAVLREGLFSRAAQDVPIDLSPTPGFEDVKGVRRVSMEELGKQAHAIAAWEVDASKDSEDSGVEMNVLRRWALWFDAYEGLRHSVRIGSAAIPFLRMALQAYNAAGRCIYAEIDRPELRWDREWLLWQERHAPIKLPPPDTLADNPAFTTAGAHIRGSQFPFVPGALPPWLNRRSDAEMDSWLNESAVDEGLQETFNIAHIMMGDSYGWRRNAELQIRWLQLRKLNGKLKLTDPTTQKLLDTFNAAQMLTHSEIGRDMLYHDGLRVKELLQPGALPGRVSGP